MGATSRAQGERERLLRWCEVLVRLLPQDDGGVDHAEALGFAKSARGLASARLLAHELVQFCERQGEGFMELADQELLRATGRGLRAEVVRRSTEWRKALARGRIANRREYDAVKEEVVKSSVEASAPEKELLDDLLFEYETKTKAPPR